MTMAANTNPDQVQSKPGQMTHGAYSLRRLVRLSKPRKRRDREMLEAARLAYAVAAGFTSWESAPQPVREVIDMAVELSLFRRALFSGFWRGAEIPKRYDGVTELLSGARHGFMQPAMIGQARLAPSAALTSLSCDRRRSPLAVEYFSFRV